LESRQGSKGCSGALSPCVISICIETIRN
jgi:hypothetical protein